MTVWAWNSDRFLTKRLWLDFNQYTDALPSDSELVIPRVDGTLTRGLVTIFNHTFNETGNLQMIIAPKNTRTLTTFDYSIPIALMQGPPWFRTAFGQPVMTDIPKFTPRRINGGWLNFRVGSPNLISVPFPGNIPIRVDGTARGNPVIPTQYQEFSFYVIRAPATPPPPGTEPPPAPVPDPVDVDITGPIQEVDGIGTLPYRLLYYGSITPTGTLGTGGGEGRDITEKVINIQKLTDVGSGEINSGIVTLSAKWGEFLSNTEAPYGVFSPLELFYLQVFDPRPQGTNQVRTYGRFLMLDDILPQRNEHASTITLELLGRERYLQKMYIPGHFWFVSFKDMLNHIVQFYNTNKGSRAPLMFIPQADLNALPDHTYGIFDFGKETTVYDAMMDVVKRLALPVAAGGAGEFYGLTFRETHATLIPLIRPVGTTLNIDRTTKTPLTITNPITYSKVQSAPEGTTVVVEGQKRSGSFPHDIAEFRSLMEEFDNIPKWRVGIAYKRNAYVRGRNGSVYQATSDHTSTNANQPPTSTWTITRFDAYVRAWVGASDLNYSTWTNQKEQLWRSWAGNPGSTSLATNFNSLTFPDSNLVIRDTNAWRDWVDFRAKRLTQIPTTYLYSKPDGTTPNTVSERTRGLYYGMRVLVDTSLTGSTASPFTGNDKFGKAYANSLVQLDRDGDWIVFRTAKQFDQCAVLTEGKVYEYNRALTTSNGKPIRNTTAATTNLAWRDTSGALDANDCFHPPSVMRNVSGLIGTPRGDTAVTLNKGTGSYLDNSAIEIEYRFNETNTMNDLIDTFFGSNRILTNFLKVYVSGALRVITNALVRDKAYSLDTYTPGWWATIFEAPFPKRTKTSNQGFTEKVGQIYGGDTTNKMPVLDLYNLNRNYTNILYGREQGQIDGVRLLMKYNISGIDIDALRGDIPFRMTLYDLEGNVWVSDQNLRFQNEAYWLDFPVSSFKIYRARQSAGFNVEDTLSAILNPELRVSEVFNQRLIKRITLQCQLEYNDAGQYDFLGWEAILRKFINITAGTQVKYTGTIDAVHFTKTPIAIAQSSNNADHQFMAPIKKYPGISNTVQLQKIATSELDIAKFQNVIYTVKMNRDVRFRAEESATIPQQSVGGFFPADGTNVIKKITYSVGADPHLSGLVTTYDLYKKVTI